MKRLAALLTTLMMAGAPCASELAPTPADARGPFYPDVLPADQDNDLVQVAGRSAAAQGRRIALSGRVLDSNGNPLPGVRVEIWQTDALGRYIHSGDPRPDERDPDFQGFGVSVSDDGGRYRFRTVEPGGYSSRPPHIHVRLVRGGRELLVTQVYLPGRSAEHWLSKDGLREREERQTVRYVASDDKVMEASFDFVLAITR